MRAREVQAERMALRCLKNGKNVTIIGKAYKPCVPYTHGSASMLVGHYIEKHGGNVRYYDKNTGDTVLEEGWTEVFLIGYWEDWVPYVFDAVKNSSVVIIDPWRKITEKIISSELIHYGDTRKKDEYRSVSDYASLENQVVSLWPLLKEHMTSIHVVDAFMTGESTFLKRPTEIIVKELLDAKKNGKTKFFFNCMSEAFLEVLVSKIHRITRLVEDDIQAKDIFYIVGTPDAEQCYDQYVNEKGIEKKISILPTHSFQYFIKNSAEAVKSLVSYNVRRKEKTFLCMNKLHREHRIQLLEKMFRLDLLPKGYYSFEGGSPNWIESLQQRNRHLDFPLIMAHKHLFPMRLNINSSRTNPVDIIADDIQYHDNSYFSVVTETVYYDDTRQNLIESLPIKNSLFLSEKTYRCFALMHPFVVLGHPGILKEIHRQGYRTFSRSEEHTSELQSH